MDICKELLRPTWIEIDLDSIISNAREIKRVIGQHTKLIPVLKGNAYGCGLIEVVEALRDKDIYGFGVGNIYEAIEIRKNTHLPILLFGNTLKNAVTEILRHHLTPSVSDLEWVEAYSKEACDEIAPIFVKIDVGLNRLGVLYTEAVKFIEAVSRLKNITVEGIQTHIVGERDYIQNGFDIFSNIINTLEKNGYKIPIKLVANSQLVAQNPATYLNAVDPGKLIYGIIPFKAEVDIRVKPAFARLVSKIIHIKKSVNVSPEKYERIGIVPIGMADGLPSQYSSNKGEVLVHGKRVSIIKVHAEHTRVDLSQCLDAIIGDEVVFIGDQMGSVIDFYEVAKKCHVTESEVLRSLSRCLPRIYYRNNHFCKILPSL
jgi:alanine racemase